MVSILDFTGLNICNTFSRIWILAESTKFRKVDAITSILRKIQNPIKFEHSLRFPIEKLNYSDFIYNYKELFNSER